MPKKTLKTNDEVKLEFDKNFLAIGVKNGYNLLETKEQFNHFKNHYINNKQENKKDWPLAFEVWITNHKNNNKENDIVYCDDKNLNKILGMFLYNKPYKDGTIEADIVRKTKEMLDGFDARDFHAFLRENQERYFSRGGYFKQNMVEASIREYKKEITTNAWNKYSYEPSFKYISEFLPQIFVAINEKYRQEEVSDILKMELLQGVTKTGGEKLFNDDHLKILSKIDLCGLYDSFNQNDNDLLTFGKLLRIEMELICLYTHKK